MAEQVANAYTGFRAEGVDPDNLGKHVMEYRVSRVVAWVCWPLTLLSACLLLLGFADFLTSSEFNADSLLLFGILLILNIASIATGLSAVRTHFLVCENGVACRGFWGNKTFHFTQIANMSVSSNPLANLRRPFSALKPHLVIDAKEPQSATYPNLPISDVRLHDI